MDQADAHEELQVCVYDDRGRWAPGLPCVPVLADEDGWMMDVGAAILAATSAAAAGSPKVVVRDRSDLAVVLIEAGVVQHPPELADVVARMRGGLRSYSFAIAAELERTMLSRDPDVCGHQRPTESRGEYLRRLFHEGQYDLAQPGQGVAGHIDVVSFVLEREIETGEAKVFARMRTGEAMELAGRGGRAGRMVLRCQAGPRGLPFEKGHERGVAR